MSERGLEDAVRALRGETGGAPATADATRMRILGTVRARRRRRVLAVRTTAVLLAAALGGAAWAAVTGRLPVLGSLSGYLGDASSTDRDPEPSGAGPGWQGGRTAEVSGSGGTAAGDSPVAPGEPAAASAGDVAGPSAPADEEPSGTGAAPGQGDGAGASARTGDGAGGGARGASSAQAAGEAAKGGAATGGAAAGEAAKGGAPSADGGAPAAADGGADAAPSDSDAAADALYQRAHALHFQAGNWSAARAAWEAYLAAAPRGRFATFAHYNRALCLLRLGRTAEARSVLGLFASGAFGGYRRAEAQSLLDALNAPSASGPSGADDSTRPAPDGGTGGEK